jgi:hypothetical protein
MNDHFKVASGPILRPRKVGVVATPTKITLFRLLPVRPTGRLIGSLVGVILWACELHSVRSIREYEYSYVCGKLMCGKSYHILA